MAEHDDVEIYAVGGDHDSDADEEPAMAKDTAARLADLRDDEACCKAQIMAAKLQKGSLAAATVRRCEGQLTVIEYQIRMSQPTQNRLKELQQSERDLVRIRDDAITKTAAAVERRSGSTGSASWNRSRLRRTSSASRHKWLRLRSSKQHTARQDSGHRTVIC